MLQCDCLLTLDSYKVLESRKIGYVNAIQYLAPHDSSERWNMCPWADGCEVLCLGMTSGKMRFRQAHKARVERTRFFMEERDSYKDRFIKEVDSVIRRAARLRMSAAIRPNGSSDVPWESVFPELFQEYPQLSIYDYTKSPERMRRFLEGCMPGCYYLVYSVGKSKDSEIHAREFLKAGGTAAVVFEGDTLPEEYLGAPVVDGDVTDIRFLDRPGSVVGLRAKGAARKSNSRFVKRPRLVQVER